MQLSILMRLVDAAYLQQKKALHGAIVHHNMGHQMRQIEARGTKNKADRSAG